MPDASFAGQQETYLNIQGENEVLDAVKRCWASLWTARAIAYRMKNDIKQEIVALAVVVQKLAFSDASGAEERTATAIFPNPAYAVLIASDTSCGISPSWKSIPICVDTFSS